MLAPVDLTIDPGALSAAARAVLDAGARPMREMAARGIAPGLKPGEALTVVALLAESPEEALAGTAKKTLANIPGPLLRGALADALQAGVLAVIAPLFASNAAVMERVLAHPSIAAETVAMVAATGSEEVTELIAVNEQRMLAHPEIIEKLYLNRSTRMSTAERVLELAVRHKLELNGIAAYKEAAAALGQELIADPSPEPTPDDVLFRETDVLAFAMQLDVESEDTHVFDPELGQEKVEEKFLPLYARLAQMTVSQKIRRAMLGTAGERLILVRDTNRLVAAAAVKSPAIQENEVVRIAASRNVSDEVLRLIATNREWTRSHQIKFNLVANPRTPLTFASRLLPHLRESELKALSRSKNVSGTIQKIAEQQLDRKKAGK
jgi:hypothetical protein